MSNKNKAHHTVTGLEIAVIGTAGKFPKAKNIDQFWDNLKKGVEAVPFYAEEELIAARVTPGLVRDPDFVRTNGSVLDDKDYFDASFFGYSPLEAEIMDPQLRIFLECSWAALENSGYPPGNVNKVIGIYAGASSNFDWKAHILMSGKSKNLGGFPTTLLTDKDQLCTQIAYNLGLQGPAVLVQTGCSTSLTAIHLASQGILNGECDMALAGGVSLSPFKSKGYLYQEGMIYSRDGHCRAFDSQANGTIGGEGAAVVVLKALNEASADNDYIYAVLKGSSITNDGRRKVGYTAPSITGQAETIRLAYHVAGVEPGTIGYIETHGTGTTVGDPIEIDALKLAFNTNKKGYCRIGSVKTNIGHLGSAAGVTGFIKAILAIKYRFIPPSLHFNTPNPRIDFENSPFYVNTTPEEWKSNGTPLRAAVSSFGIGGTNVHVILEEAPDAQGAEREAQSPGRKSSEGTRGLAPLPDVHASRKYQLIVLSAKTPSALEQTSQNLVDHFKKNPGINLADAAYTLQVGRPAFNYRRTAVCPDLEQAVQILSRKVELKSQTTAEDPPPVVFMFPGLGGQYENMGRQLYEKEPLFHREMGRCFEILDSLIDCEIKEILYPEERKIQGPKLKANKYHAPSARRSAIDQIEIAQIVIFILEYALAKFLMACGIKPRAMIGYSFGEYTAACLAGVFSLKDALKVVVSRGQLLEKLPPGAMTSVPLKREELAPYLTPGLSIAIDNGLSCIVSGTNEALEALERKLQNNRYLCMRIRTSRALHSPMMDPILDQFEEEVSHCTLNSPQIPYISNVTGSWQTSRDAVDPGYWSNHMRQTVRYAEGINVLLKKEKLLFLEVGPGRDLCALVSRYQEKNSQPFVLNLLPDEEKNVPSRNYLLHRIGQLWQYGQKINWPGFYHGEKRHRIPLPTYPFERQYFPIDDNPFKTADHKVKKAAKTGQTPQTADLSDWFYIPSWKRTLPPKANASHPSSSELLLVFADTYGLAHRLLQQGQENNKRIVTVRAGTVFKKINEKEFIINPGNKNHYRSLLKKVHANQPGSLRVIHMWCIAETTGEISIESVKKDLEPGFYSLLYLVQALSGEAVPEARINVITNNIQDVTGNEDLCPGKSTVLGLVQVIPQEFPNIDCRGIDIDLPKPGSPEEKKLPDRIWAEIKDDSPHRIAAYRGNHRWEQEFEPVRLTDTTVPLLKKNGVYLITGGLGKIGLMLAKDLSRQLGARLILTGRSFFPRKQEWKKFLETHNHQDTISTKIRKIQEIEAIGGEVTVISADAARREQVRQLIASAEQRFGPLNGVIHAAGVTDRLTPLDGLEKKECERQFQAKVYGLLVMEELLREKKLDFCLLISSLSSVLGGLGMAAYSAANIFMDTFVQGYSRRNPAWWLSVNWDGRESGKNPEAFQRILSTGNINRLVVSTDGNLQQRIDRWIKLESLKPLKKTDNETCSPLLPRPSLMNPYEAPRTPLEQSLTQTWEKILGYRQIGICDDFIELGGDSLKMITVLAKVQKEWNVRVPLTKFYKKPTIQQLAAYITDGKANSYPTSLDPDLVLLTDKNHGKTSKKHLFILHEATGDVEGYMQFCHSLEIPLNCWGIRAEKIENHTPRNITIQELAAAYIEKIKTLQANGPYYIAGWSLGGIIAFEMAVKLEQQNQEIGFLGLIDTPGPHKQSQKKTRGFTRDSELKWIGKYLPDPTLREKLHAVTRFNQFWPVTLNYLETSGFSIDKIKSTVPPYIAQTIPHFHRLELKELIDSINTVRSLANAVEHYQPAQKAHSPIYFFKASRSMEIHMKTWNSYTQTHIHSYEITGDHFSILKIPGVVPFAQTVSKILETL